MSNIPNLITSIRLLAALALIWLTLTNPEHSLRSFLPLFVAASVSDMLDGFIARRFNWCTEFGAKLDSISDLLLYAAVFLFLWLNAAAYLARCIPFLVIGAAVQLFHLLLAYIRLGQFPAYHTTFSRVCAYLMFAGIVTFWQIKSPYILPLLSIVWIACSAEGIIITLVLRHAATNLSGIRQALTVK